MKDKYTNYEDDYFVTKSDVNRGIKVTRYLVEDWGFDGTQLTKDSTYDGSTTKIPSMTLSIPEFLTYTDEMDKLRATIVEPKPIRPRKVA